MNAAWGGIYDYDQVYISLAPHKTTENLEVSKAFTVSFATKKTAEKKPATKKATKKAE